MAEEELNRHRMVHLVVERIFLPVQIHSLVLRAEDRQPKDVYSECLSKIPWV